jgi:hypothetical protein
MSTVEKLREYSRTSLTQIIYNLARTDGCSLNDYRIEVLSDDALCECGVHGQCLLLGVDMMSEMATVFTLYPQYALGTSCFVPSVDSRYPQ